MEQILTDGGLVEISSEELTDDGFHKFLFTLYPNGALAVWENNHRVETNLPDWLADGIRELVKNKIEQENNRGA